MLRDPGESHLTRRPYYLMSAARFRFYAELNDFLPVENRGKVLTRCFSVSGSVKDFVEGFGVPHTEVDLVLANGKPVDFSYPVRDGDLVSVYPVFESLDIASVSRVRPAPLRVLRFLLDVHVGRLAAYLRMAGFDALYGSQASDAELASIVAREGRVLLTRDRYLLMRTAVERGYWVRSTQPKQQLLEVVKRFDLAGSMRPFTRCLDCNTILEAASREAVWERLPPKIRDKDVFRICPGCWRVYWEGSHHERMSKLLSWVKANVSPMGGSSSQAADLTIDFRGESSYTCEEEPWTTSISARPDFASRVSVSAV